MADAASLLIKLGFRADTHALEGIERRLDGLNNKVRFLAGTEIVRGLFNLSTRFGDTAFEIENAASAAGITTDALQKLQYSATQAGADANELGASMFHLARNLYQARMGGQEAMQSFYQLGISSQQISSFKSTEDALYGVMDALRKIQDPIKQQALLEAVMGRGSRGMMRFVLAGSQAAKASGNTAEAMNALISPVALERLAKARQSLMTLHRLFDAVAATVGSTFAPVIIKTVDAIRDFYVLNEKTINLSLHDWVVGAAGALGYFVGLMETAGKGLFDFIARHKDLVWTIVKLKGALKGINVVLQALKPTIALFSGGIGALAILFEAAPIIAAAFAIGVLTFLIHDLWTALTGGDTDDMWFVQLIEGKGKIGAAMDKLFGMTANVVDFFAPGTMRPAVAGATVRGMAPDDPKLRALAATGDSMARALQLPSSIATAGMATPAPEWLLRPGASNQYDNSVQTRSINMPVTINTGGAMSPEQAMQAVVDGVRRPLDMQQELDHAARRLDHPAKF